MFAIVSPNDKLIYSCDLSRDDVPRDDPPHLDEFILYSSLDIVDRVKGVSNDAYLKVVDKFNDFLVSAFVPISSVRFLLLHKQVYSEEAIRIFFQETYSYYIKLVTYNLSYSLGSLISSDQFDSNVRMTGKKLLTI